MAEFRMPSLGADMAAGTLVEWLVQPGDTVHRGDIVAVVETEKAAIEVEVFTDGTVEELLVAPGAKVPVGTPLALLGDAPDAAAVTPDVPVPATPPPAIPATPPGPVLDTPPAPVPTPVGGALVYSPLVRHLAEERDLPLDALVGSGPGGLLRRADVEAGPAPQRPSGNGRGRPRVSPRARRQAAELGVDLSAVAGTGPGGSITAADVEQAGGPTAPTAPTVPSEAAAASSDPQASMRRAIARLMDRSNREIPHFYLAHDTDMTTALAWLAGENERRPLKRRLLPAVLLLKAAALAAVDVPGVNGHWLDERFVPATGVELGVAVSLRGGGLVTPVIPDAAALDLDGVMAALQGLVSRTRKGRLRGSDLAEGTLTVTNLGDQGVEVVYGVIHPPQVALVGFGTVTERPFAAGGLVGARPTVTVTLAADHRAIDGRLGAAFLQAIDRHLQAPEAL
jgi:pyruvate dehydrogenase E2 component (dihydrolipoamide acetyltransferase)